MMIMPHTSAHDFIWDFLLEHHWFRNEFVAKRNYLFSFGLVLNTWEESR
jgi:hypothetical protein